MPDIVPATDKYTVTLISFDEYQARMTERSTLTDEEVIRLDKRLFNAAMDNASKKVEALLKMGADPNACDVNGVPVIALTSHIDCVKTLLVGRGVVHLPYKGHIDPLLHRINKGQFEHVLLLYYFLVKNIPTYFSDEKRDHISMMIANVITKSVKNARAMSQFFGKQFGRDLFSRLVEEKIAENKERIMLRRTAAGRKPNPRSAALRNNVGKQL